MMRLLNRVMKITKLSRENRELKKKIVELSGVKDRNKKLYKIEYSIYIFSGGIGTPMDGYFFLKDISEEIIDINLDIHLDELKNKFKNSRVCIYKWYKYKRSFRGGLLWKRN